MIENFSLQQHQQEEKFTKVFFRQRLEKPPNKCPFVLQPTFEP